jgi:hypothetical protein
MFAVLPAWATSIHVGSFPTRARFNLHNSSEVIQLLEELVSVSERSEIKKQRSAISKPDLELQQP